MELTRTFHLLNLAKPAVFLLVLSTNLLQISWVSTSCDKDRVHTSMNNIYKARVREQVSICTQPADPGRGIAATPRYFFNSSSRHCEEFIYGGCGGNGNNFMTSEACNQQCNPNGCPPYCNVEYCSSRTTRTALCTIPNPQENSLCTADCRITNCKVCYFADEFRPLDALNCTSCSHYPTVEQASNQQCFRQWATCTRRANGDLYPKARGRSERTQERFKCYEHPCL